MFELNAFDYEDIQLIPNKCIVNSRSECDTTVNLGKHTFKLPVVPANMQTVIDESVAEFLAENGYFYIMHRFDEASRLPFVKRMKERGLISSIRCELTKYGWNANLPPNPPSESKCSNHHAYSTRFRK